MEDTATSTTAPLTPAVDPTKMTLRDLLADLSQHLPRLSEGVAHIGAMIAEAMEGPAEKLAQAGPSLAAWGKQTAAEYTDEMRNAARAIEAEPSLVDTVNRLRRTDNATLSDAVVVLRALRQAVKSWLGNSAESAEASRRLACYIHARARIADWRRGPIAEAEGKRGFQSPRDTRTFCVI